MAQTDFKPTSLCERLTLAMIFTGGTTRVASKSSNISVIRHIIKTEGVLGLGRGLGITIGRETISCGLYFAT